MGFRSFFKNLFSGEDEDEAELDAARARHGIQLTAQDKAAMNKTVSEEERFGQEYDVWEELKHFRTSFYLGTWVARKFHIIGEDKVKQQLDDLEKKRRAEEEKKAQKEGEG